MSDSKLSIISDLNNNLDNEEKAILRFIFNIPDMYPDLMLDPEIHNLLQTRLSIAMISEGKPDPVYTIDYLTYFAPNEFVIMNDLFLKGLTSTIIAAVGHSNILTSQFLKQNPETYSDLYKRTEYVNDVPEEVKRLYNENPRKWHIAFATINRNPGVLIGEYIKEEHEFNYHKYQWFHYYKLFVEYIALGKIKLCQINLDILNLGDDIMYINNCREKIDPFDENESKKYERLKADFKEFKNVSSLFDVQIQEFYPLNVMHKESLKFENEIHSLDVEDEFLSLNIENDNLSSKEEGELCSKTTENDCNINFVVYVPILSTIQSSLYLLIHNRKIIRNILCSSLGIYLGYKFLKR